VRLEIWTERLPILPFLHVSGVLARSHKKPAGTPLKPGTTAQDRSTAGTETAPPALTMQVLAQGFPAD
jgi:hypothetical protein